MYFHPEKNKGKRPVCAAQEARVRRKGPLYWEQAVPSMTSGLHWGRQGRWLGYCHLEKALPEGPEASPE